MTNPRSRDDILELATRAKQAVHTPSSFMTELLIQQQQYTCLHWLCHFNILTRIPIPPSSISYHDLAKTTNVPESSLRAVTRMVMTTGFLHEPTPDHVSHSALSAPFIQDPHLMTWMLHMVNHTVPFMNGFIRATEKFGPSQKAAETAFNVAFNTDLAYFPYLKSKPELEREFDAYMQSQSKAHGGAKVEHLLDGFDWASLRDRALVVDDQATPIANARKQKSTSPDDIWRRTELQEHDFFGPQNIKGADVYLLRMIIHDWPDDKAVVILQRLAQAMGPQSRILIMDMVIPAPGAGPVLAEAALREKDLCMRQVFNAKERETGDWYALVGKVSSKPGLRIKGIIRRPDGCQHSVIEVVLDGNGVNGVAR
ncbi:S-adenosyl-L-methionine-dependent methyltransferase [Bombardia bombarda]|uniref:S-adenosyl-L-methionine-dependent methyltransferase n=1 Tax=Bombardia bombarda TaxID=252184 RepID=A0AA39XNX3_9PEZI|nr:S-adenosyl-L-methionine-dependent methyltransferase [Bombardia bombarda]